MTPRLLIAGATLGACVLGPDLTAQQQQQSQEELIAKRDAKLEQAWLDKADWILDYEEALAKAGESGKLVFGYFTRSYSP